MILTDKAKEDYKKWLSNYSEKYHHLQGWRDYDNYLDEVELPEILQYTLIQEWLDSVGIYITIGYLKEFYNDFVDDTFKSRAEALKEAIKHANNLYNERA